MKPIPILTEPTSRYFIFPNGQIADVYALRYDAKVDLENMMFISIAEREEYKNSTLPTINNLFDKGVMSEGTCIEREYKIFLPHKRSLSEQDFKDIKKEFEATIYKVYNLKDTYNGRERFLPFSQWDYRVTDIVCDYKGVVIPDVFRLACGVFTKSNAPKVGDRVKLRYRIHKKTFEDFDMGKARIVEIIKA